MVLCQIQPGIVYGVTMTIISGLVLALAYFFRKWMKDEENSRDKLGKSIDDLASLFREFRDEMISQRVKDRDERTHDREEFVKIKEHLEFLQKEHDRRICKKD